jgi:hypothetical protein
MNKESKVTKEKKENYKNIKIKEKTKKKYIF